jgi:hypothetical protein
MDWKDIYQQPFLWDEYGHYVWSNNGTMTFTFDFSFDNTEKLNIIGKIVEKLNGNNNIKFDNIFKLQDNIDFFYNDEFAFCIRGWGKLTGTGGGLNLSTDEAMKIQDEFAKWVLQTLND